MTDIHGDHMDPVAITAVQKDSTAIIAAPAVVSTVTEAIDVPLVCMNALCNASR
jgi:hypothetical protein